MPDKRICILLLEDSLLDAELIEARLARGGIDFAMDRVDTREDYVAALETGRYDLILADYSLPSFDGLSALEIAREGWPHLPFVFVSGGLGEEVAIDSLRRGATDYLLKGKLDRLAPAVSRAIAEASERTGRRRTEVALRESEERHRLILETVKDYAIITLDTDGRVSGWNRGAEQVLGHPEVEILGQSVERIFSPEDVRAGVPQRELGQAAMQGRAEDERWYIRDGGVRFWGSGIVRPLLGEGGNLCGFVKVVRDMTERKRIEEELRDADRRKDEFLAMLAHELRNPLSAINNAIHLTRKSTREEHLAWAKDVIGQQTRHLTRLIDDLLDVSRITRGKIQLRTGPQDPAALVRNAVEAVRSLVEARGHRLDVSIAPGTMRVEADPTRLEQILVNLLTNAAKYTEPGGRIELTAAPEGSDLVIRVADDGIGIAPEMLPRIFEPFVQVEQTIDRSQGGLGIGLTLARKLAEMHGGSVSAASRGRGQGSAFTLRLPLTLVPAEEAAGADGSAGEPAGRGPRVLVVDDNVPSARGLAMFLELHGHEVETAHDGRSALEAIRHYRPEVVLLDIGLPGMDGYQVAGRIRREAGPEAPLIIAVTGYGQEEDRRRSLEAGLDHHLVKPLDFEELLSLLARPEATRTSSVPDAAHDRSAPRGSQTTPRVDLDNPAIPHVRDRIRGGVPG